jgi:hypothetical protein
MLPVDYNNRQKKQNYIFFDFECTQDDMIQRLYLYTYRPGEWKPELGDYLGDLTDEVPDNRLIEFVTGGPKNNAYKIAKPDKDGNTTICKVRGITLNYKNSLTINFDTIKDMVINNRDDVKTVMDDFKITRDHKRIISVHQDKDYRIVFDKRVIMQDYST